MFRNFIKTAWRNLIKNPFYSLINISGLAAGLAIGILILLWVQDEFSFDSFHRQGRDIYKLENMVGTGSSRQLWTETTAPIGIMAKKEIPGVEEVVRMSNNGFYALFKYGDKVFQEQHNYFIDPSLFSVFDFRLVNGNAANPFPDENSIVITESTAKKYFGKEEAIGKVIRADDKINFTVRGVIMDFPRNSSIQADMLFPMTLLQKNFNAGATGGQNLDNDFRNFNYTTFLLLKPGMNLSELAVKIRNIHLRNKADDTDIGYVFLPVEKMHLYHSDGSEGGLGSVRMFIMIAILILIIACINYVNLSTARSMLRAKEISLRKIVGAARTQLFLQFIVETAVLFLFAFLFSVTLVYLLMPGFNKISGKELSFSLSDYHIWKVILLTIAGTLVISSIYPALLLSSFEPLKAMKGKISARISDALFRKILVVIQFAFSMVLITGTLVIGKQLSFIRSKELGYDKEHVLSCNMMEMGRHVETVKAELLKEPGINNVTWASENIVDLGGQTGDNTWDGKMNGETMMVSPMAIDRNFIPFFKMHMMAGQPFTGSIADSTHFILNETAVEATRLKNPVGKKFKLWKTEGTIIGVVKDFHFASMRRKIDPAVFYYNPGTYGILYIKTTAKDAPQAIAALQKQWNQYNAGFPFTYSFLDETFDNLYKGETRTGVLFNVFAGMAIFISCLGLLGLASYTAQVRTREIGVRKVLGASVGGIIRLVASDFIKLVMISIVLAIPVSWFAMNKWLQDFAYKINIGWMVFFVAGIISLLIAALTISIQSVKAAIANPVKSLRSE